MKLRHALLTCVLGVSLCMSAAHSQTIALSIDADKPGAKIDRHLFGQFAEHLGSCIYGGIWVGPDSPIPEMPAATLLPSRAARDWPPPE